jgi:hypothetical protein
MTGEPHLFLTLEAQAHQRFTTRCCLAGRPHTDHVPGSRAPERAVRCAAPAHRDRLQGPQRPLSQEGQQGVPEARHHACGLLPVPAPSCVSWSPRKHRRMRCEFLGRRQLCLKWHAEPQRTPHTSHQPEPRLCSCCDSESRGAFTPIEATPLKFREDGQPISACRLPGRPLMVGRCTCCECLPVRSAGMKLRCPGCLMLSSVCQVSYTEAPRVAPMQCRPSWLLSAGAKASRHGEPGSGQPLHCSASAQLAHPVRRHALFACYKVYTILR